MIVVIVLVMIVLMCVCVLMDRYLWLAYLYVCLQGWPLEFNGSEEEPEHSQ